MKWHIRRQQLEIFSKPKNGRHRCVVACNGKISKEGRQIVKLKVVSNRKVDDVRREPMENPAENMIA
jgi:hypothetical protein